jgi:hypothetical protein
MNKNFFWEQNPCIAHESHPFIHTKVRKIGLGGRLGARRDGGARINGQIGNLVGQAEKIGRLGGLGGPRRSWAGLGGEFEKIFFFFFQLKIIK